MIVGCGFAVTALTGGIPAVGGIALTCSITGLSAGIAHPGDCSIYENLTLIKTFAVIFGTDLIGLVGGYIRVIIALTPKTTVSSPDIARKGGRETEISGRFKQCVSFAFGYSS